MRHLALLFVLLALAAPLVGCAGTAGCGAPPTLGVQLPSFTIPPPVLLTPTNVPPQFVPQNYAQVVQVPVQSSYAPVQTYAAPQAAPCAAPQGYSRGYEWAPPPVPRATSQGTYCP